MAQFENMHKVDLANGTAPIVQMKWLAQNDKQANRFGAIVTRNGEAVALGGGCSGTAILADGSTVPLTGTVNGNEAWVTLPDACYTVEGQIIVAVNWYSGDSRTTLIWGTGTVKQTDTGTVIDPGTIIPSVADLIQDIADAVATIPADYSVLSSLVNAQSVTAKKESTQDGLYHLPLVWVRGNINASYAESSSGAWTKTANYFPVQPGDVLIYNGNTDEGGTTISRYVIAYNASIAGISRVPFPTSGYTVPENAAFVRFSFGFGSSTGKTDPPATDGFDIVYNGSYLNTNLAEIRQDVAENQAYAVTGEAVLYDHLYGEADPTITWLNGKTLAANGHLATNADYVTSDFLPCADVVNVDIALASGESVPNTYICRYSAMDEDLLIGEREAISSAAAKSHSAFLYGAKYFRIAIKTTLANAEANITFHLTGTRQHKGRLYALGDSITEGTWNNGGGSSGPQYSRCYIQTMADLCGYDLTNLAEHGSGLLAAGATTGKSLKDFIDGNTFTDADLLIIAYGVNDYIGNQPVGTVADAVGAATCAGQLKYALDALTGDGTDGVSPGRAGKAPYARIVLLLPMNARRKFDSLPTTPTYALNWYMGTPNAEALTLQDYRDMIRAVGEYYGVQVLDLNEIAPINRGNLRMLTGDGLHPTKDGHIRIGTALASYFD